MSIVAGICQSLTQSGLKSPYFTTILLYLKSGYEKVEMQEKYRFYRLF